MLWVAQILWPYKVGHREHLCLRHLKLCRGSGCLGLKGEEEGEGISRCCVLHRGPTVSLAGGATRVVQLLGRTWQLAWQAHALHLGDGFIPHQAGTGAPAPPLAEKLLTTWVKAGGGEGPRSPWAVQARVPSLGFPVKFQLKFSHLQIPEQRWLLPSRCQGEQ